MLVRRLGLLPMELQLLMLQELSLLLVRLRLPENQTASNSQRSLPLPPRNRGGAASGACTRST